MGVFDFSKSVYGSLLNSFFHILNFLFSVKNNKFSPHFGSFLTRLSLYLKKREPTRIKKDAYEQSKCIEQLEEALRARERYTKQLKRRYHESCRHVRELMEISNKLTQHSNAFFYENFDINIINKEIEKILKSLEDGCLVPLIVSEFNIFDLIAEIMASFFMELRKKKIQLHNTSKGQEFFIQSDAFLLKKILIYLLVQTLSRLPKNGVIEIKIQLIKGKINIQMRDNGYHLEEDIFSNLFFQAEGANLTNQRAFLNLVKELKGDVKLQYKPQGKHITELWFPLRLDVK